ncbi:MAG TPA: carboxypeptidase-like regulatory domain-containing protein [Blastocatellia bacterium]|nr:carboxypeptidase-like regulatory domain-containing protein [Blastocatellia bacterium]
MKQALRLWAVIAIGAIACASTPAFAATARGSIRGFIMDGHGTPLVGAAVMVMAEAEDAKPAKVIKRASTDGDGKFLAAGITPGRYRVKAEADGFKSVEIAADVKPNKVTVFDSISLLRTSVLAEETSLNKDSKYAARGAKNVIFHYDESKKIPADAKADDAIALTDRTPEIHGVVNTFGQTSASSSAEAGSFAGANFALSEQISKDVNLVVSGQVGYGDGAPQRLETLTTAHAGDRHRFAVALGYGRFTFSRRAGLPRLGQFSVSATDTWQVAGPVLVVYGLEVAHFAEGASSTSILPKFGLAVDAGARTRLSAALLPGSSSDTQSKVNLESGVIEFPEPKPVAMDARPGEGPEPILDRSYRLQFGAEQILSDRSSVEVMAFFDTVSGHGVGLLAIPNDNSQAEPILKTAEQVGRTRGLRVVYHHRLNKMVEGSVGYSFGEGQRFDARGITEPANMFSNASFHVFSAKVDANFVSTGTKVSTVLRLAPEQAVFAIDPFQGQIGTYDPNVSISLAQDLPSLSFIPGQWQAIVDLRNLLDQQSSVGDERQEMVASRFHRLVRVGLSLRF